MTYSNPMTFVGSAPIGGAAVHAGVLIASDARSYGHAVPTALLGALVGHWSNRCR